MVQQELRKLAVYLFFLAILIIPMLGFRSASFESQRAFKTLAVFAAILVLNFIVKAIRQGRDTVRTNEKSWVERFGEKVNRIPRIYTLGGLILLAATFPLMANNYMIDVGITCLIYVCLGLGLNIVVGLCGLLDLGYIAFMGLAGYFYAYRRLDARCQHVYPGFYGHDPCVG